MFTAKIRLANITTMAGMSQVTGGTWTPFVAEKAKEKERAAGSAGAPTTFAEIAPK